MNEKCWAFLEHKELLEYMDVNWLIMEKKIFNQVTLTSQLCTSFFTGYHYHDSLVTGRSSSPTSVKVHEELKWNTTRFCGPPNSSQCPTSPSAVVIAPLATKTRFPEWRHFKANRVLIYCHILQCQKYVLVWTATTTFICTFKRSSCANSFYNLQMWTCSVTVIPICLWPNYQSSVADFQTWQKNNNSSKPVAPRTSTMRLNRKLFLHPLILHHCRFMPACIYELESVETLTNLVEITNMSKWP